MTRDLFIKNIVPETIGMNLSGFIADELTPEQFEKMHKVFFDSIMKIKESNIEELQGYGELNDDNKTDFTTCRDYILNTFSEEKEGYWYHWRGMFTTTSLREDFFEKYYLKMEERIKFCEGERYLVNNNTFFTNLITDGKSKVGFLDWSRAGVTDFLLDFAIMDLNKPYLQVPENLFSYFQAKKIGIPNFKERFLCMAYFKGIDTLRWHASIDDLESCTSIMTYLEGLEDRIMNL